MDLSQILSEDEKNNFFVSEIVEFFKKDIYTPKRFLKDLTGIYGLHVWVNDDGKLVVHHSNEGDLLKLPTRLQIKGFLKPNKIKYTKDLASNIDEIERIINNNRFSQEHYLDTYIMFFFSIRQVNDRIVIGNGRDRNHFRALKQALSFFDRIYCHHILAYNRLKLANIVIDLTDVKPPQPKRLVARRSTRG